MAAEERGSPREAVCGLAPLAEENGGKPGGGSDVESQATFRGSWQEDAPPPYDLSPPLSRAPSCITAVHLADLTANDMFTISRLRMTTRDLEEPAPPPHRNPLVRAGRWYSGWALPGLGLFVEAWMVFAIGNIKPLLKIDFPHCFGHEAPPDCDTAAADAATYVEVSGIILGMLAMGWAADWIGRKWGSRLASSLMLLGGVLLTGCAGSGNGFLAFFLTALFILGTGVGSEYPCASASAAERAEGSKEMRRRRGETVLLTFSQQGWGNLSNTLCIALLLAMQGATGEAVSEAQAEITWRVQFAVGTAVCLALAAYRWMRLQESKVWLAERRDVEEQVMPPKAAAAQRRTSKEYRAVQRQGVAAVLRFYWPRVLVTSLAWALGGFAFFGQKLFQADFIALIVGPGATIYQQMWWGCLNNGVALVGYYAAAALIDRRWYGRVRMQAVGFGMLALLFLLMAALYNTLLDHTGAFQLLYYLATLFTQLGPNCVTFLVAGEVYPTSVRSFFHGISAAAGKVGALVAAAAFTNISKQAAFYASAGASAAGLLLTVLLLPDTTGLDLHEIDRMHRYLMSSQYHHYHGEAVNPSYLSIYERWRRYGRFYSPEKDYAHKQMQMHPHLGDAAASLASRSRAASLARLSRAASRAYSVAGSTVHGRGAAAVSPRPLSGAASPRLQRDSASAAAAAALQAQLSARLRAVAAAPPPSESGTSVR